MQHRRSVDEAYGQGRDQGFDRGYEEGFAAARAEMRDRRLPAPSRATTRAAQRPACQDGGLEERRVLGLGLLGLLAYGAWRLLRTWPGRLVAVGSVVVFSGVVSFAVLVLALVVAAAVLAWATKTAERAVADTRRGVRELRAAASALRRR